MWYIALTILVFGSFITPLTTVKKSGITATNAVGNWDIETVINMNTIIKLFNASLFSIVMIGCTLDIPPLEIEVPPIENNTTVILQLPDGYASINSIEEVIDATDPEEVTCEYQHFPDYYSNGGIVLGCTGRVDPRSGDFVCCTWIFYEEKQICEERWCRDKPDLCGWHLDSWSCYSN
jgi:hypothetical protein